MSAKKYPAPPFTGQRFDYPPSSPHARCSTCKQPRTPLFYAAPDTHALERAGELCARCWSRLHDEVAELCPHCGEHPDDLPELDILDLLKGAMS